MLGAPVNAAAIKTTSYKVVLPFYLYASLSFLISTVLLFASTEAFSEHYFHPKILALTHTLALGWCTMIIFGASHQLVPVLIEGKLYSDKLAYLTFLFAASGIPLLVYGFFDFNMETPARWGGLLVVLSILAYFLNIVVSISKSNSKNVHTVFVLTATFWLFCTAFLGLLLVYNFTTTLLPKESLHYLPLHAHAGITGWFLLLVIGVASRLIPMFLISKYVNTRLLWLMYILINTALLLYLIIFTTIDQNERSLIPISVILIAVLLFIYYCFQSFNQRLRKQVDEQMKISLLSVFMLLLPIILLMVMIFGLLMVSHENMRLILCYGFLIFFGWLTAIILGMTFKTLPFIVWNKVYHHRSALGKTPSPKDLFHHTVFKFMGIAYLAGFVLFIIGILMSSSMLLKTGAGSLIITAVLYNWNVIKIIHHKAVKA